MLKLFKYNWKQSETLFYSMLGVTIVLFIPLLILGRTNVWWDEFVTFAAISIVSIVLQALVIVIIYNFNASLKSITRRLLPVSRISEYIAYLLIPIAYNFIFAIIMWLFFVLLKPEFQIAELNAIIETFNMGEVGLSVFIFTLFYSIFGSMMLFFAVAFARMFKTNLRILIFLATYMGISIIYGIGLQLINPNSAVIRQGTILIDLESTEFAIQWLTFNWSIIVELLFALVLAVITVYIMKRKIEV